jgi:hypothetical protein
MPGSSSCAVMFSLHLGTTLPVLQFTEDAAALSNITWWLSGSGPSLGSLVQSSVHIPILTLPLLWGIYPRWCETLLWPQSPPPRAFVGQGGEWQGQGQALGQKQRWPARTPSPARTPVHFLAKEVWQTLLPVLPPGGAFWSIHICCEQQGSLSTHKQGNEAQTG